jgi:hypothetical protein
MVHVLSPYQITQRLWISCCSYNLPQRRIRSAQTELQGSNDTDNKAWENGAGISVLWCHRKDIFFSEVRIKSSVLEMVSPMRIAGSIIALSASAIRPLWTSHLVAFHFPQQSVIQSQYAPSCFVSLKSSSPLTLAFLLGQGVHYMMRYIYTMANPLVAINRSTAENAWILLFISGGPMFHRRQVWQ